jgi:hypothetical protein
MAAVVKFRNVLQNFLVLYDQHHALQNELIAIKKWSEMSFDTQHVTAPAIVYQHSFGEYNSKINELRPFLNDAYAQLKRLWRQRSRFFTDRLFYIRLGTFILSHDYPDIIEALNHVQLYPRFREMLSNNVGIAANMPFNEWFIIDLEDEQNPFWVENIM